MVIEDLVKTVLTELRAITRTETVVGEPIEMGEVTIVPVSKISVGFGVGGGTREKKEGAGEVTGGGVSIEPLAFFVVRGEKVELITIHKEETGLGKVIDLVPQLVDKVKGYKDKKSKDAQEPKAAKSDKGKAGGKTKS